MESFAPFIDPWLLESSFLDGHQDFSHHRPVMTTPTIPTAFITTSISSTSSTSSTISNNSCSGSYNNDDYIGYHQDHAIDPLVFTQGNPKFYPSPAYSPTLDLYSPSFAVSSVDVPVVSHQGDVDVLPPHPQQQQRRRQRQCARSASLFEKNSYYCQHPGCGKIFTRPYNLTSHMRTHTSERPYACSHCGRRFARQHDMNRHEKLHWNIKPYVCSNCSKPFARMDALNRHLRVENGCGSAVAAVTAAMATSNNLFVYYPAQ